MWALLYYPLLESVNQRVPRRFPTLVTVGISDRLTCPVDRSVYNICEAE